MILELLEYCFTPASRVARKLGFLKSSIQVRSRYTRCRGAWESHLRNTRSAIESAVHACATRRRVVLLGAGLLHDIPLETLSSAFEEVLLVDIVHTLGTRRASKRFANVHPIPADVTECAELLLAARDPKKPVPKPSPALLLDDTRVDLTISVNLLSQLGWIPGRVLEGFRHESEIDELKSHLIHAHLEYLRRVPGRSALITDFEWSRHPANRPRNKPLSQWSVLQGVRLPAADQTWEWNIAPAPEKEADVDWVARTAFFCDWKAASCHITSRKAGSH